MVCVTPMSEDMAPRVCTPVRWPQSGGRSEHPHGSSRQGAEPRKWGASLPHPASLLPVSAAALSETQLLVWARRTGHRGVPRAHGTGTGMHDSSARGR